MRYSPLEFLKHAVALLRQREGAAMATFRYSIVYLMALFGVLLADHHVPLLPLGSLV